MHLIPTTPNRNPIVRTMAQDVACEDADQEQREQFEALRAELHSCLHA